MKSIFKLFAYTLLSLFALSILLVIIYKYAPIPYSPLMFIRAYEQKAEGRSTKIIHHWVPLSEIASDLPLAVICSEDQKFFQHNGFDIEEILKAYQEAQKGGRKRGASTISQQTAKNVFLYPSSTWLRKGLEMYFTMLIELFWSKERILEAYLNTIEMGDGIYGAEAVANEHFGCSAKDLSRSQCALIAISLPNPLKMNSSRPSPYMYKRQKWLFKQMNYFQQSGSMLLSHE